MLGVINELSRNTTARENGLATSSDAMNHFCALMIGMQTGSLDSYRNRLEWITTYSGLDENLKKLAEEKCREIDTSLSKESVKTEGVKLR